MKQESNNFLEKSPGANKRRSNSFEGATDLSINNLKDNTLQMKPKIKENNYKIKLEGFNGSVKSSKNGGSRNNSVASKSWEKNRKQTLKYIKDSDFKLSQPVVLNKLLPTNPANTSSKLNSLQ